MNKIELIASQSNQELFSNVLRFWTYEAKKYHTIISEINVKTVHVSIVSILGTINIVL